MKVLLLHPNDSAEIGPWSESHWDWIVDIGWSGRSVYSSLTKRLGCRVSSLKDCLGHEQHHKQLVEVLQAGRGYLVDAEGVDWWDIFSPLPHDGLDQALVLTALAGQLHPAAEIMATRAHAVARGLSVLLGREIKSFTQDSGSSFGNRLARYRKAAATFRPAQILQIAMDKWDADYRFRRHLSPAPPASTEPAILLPSSYVNVSRVQVAYARMLPRRTFLLTTTRPSGGHVERPKNVGLRSLASYAPKSFLRSTELEYAGLLERWRKVQSTVLACNPVLSLAQQLGVLAAIPAFFHRGLRVRDAWRNLFDREPLCAVLSGDENSPYTRLPVLLARARGIPTVFADHGALNMTFALRPLVSASYLVQGEMARDYIVNFCGIPAERVIAGAPAQTSPSRPPSDAPRDRIVLFSEAYEINGARTESFYREILPHLCTLAVQTRRKIIVKLHPFESFRERSRFVRNLLSSDQQSLVELREGPMTPDLLSRAWFSLTVESSVAVESTLQGVPCFLCRWFDSAWYEYGTQFAKFSAGQLLHGPEEILDIPKRLEALRITPAMQERLLQPIEADRLDALLSSAPAKSPQH